MGKNKLKRIFSVLVPMLVMCANLAETPGSKTPRVEMVKTIIIENGAPAGPENGDSGDQVAVEDKSIAVAAPSVATPSVAAVRLQDPLQNESASVAVSSIQLQGPLQDDSRSTLASPPGESASPANEGDETKNLILEKASNSEDNTTYEEGFGNANMVHKHYFNIHDVDTINIKTDHSNGIFIKNKEDSDICSVKLITTDAYNIPIVGFEGKMCNIRAEHCNCYIEAKAGTKINVKSNSVFQLETKNMGDIVIKTGSCGVNLIEHMGSVIIKSNIILCLNIDRMNGTEDMPIYITSAGCIRHCDAGHCDEGHKGQSFNTGSQKRGWSRHVGWFPLWF